jgi:hypothetical protein
MVGDNNSVVSFILYRMIGPYPVFFYYRTTRGWFIIHVVVAEEITDDLGARGTMRPVEVQDHADAATAMDMTMTGGNALSVIPLRIDCR